MHLSSPVLPALTAEERRRYARHLTLPQIGPEGQRRLRAARVLVVGVGGLGSPAAMYLAAAGVGALGLVDHDAVDLSNLQRQVLHGTAAVGTPKLASAALRLRDLNPDVALEPHPARLTGDNALAILADYDLVVDGSDNFPTRYLLNDACALLGKPLVYGSIHRFEGQVSVFWAERGPCYRCLFREPPPPDQVPSCEEGGVLGVLPGIVGTLQATEAIKLVLEIGEPLVGRLLLVDALAMRFRELRLDKDPECPLCGAHPTIRTLIDYDAFCGVGPRGAREPARMEVTPLALKDEIAAGRKIVLVDVREQWELDLCRIAGSVHIPMYDLPARLDEIDRAATVVTVCHRGGRSLQAAMFLKANGFADVRSLRGGVDVWAADVEPGMARY
jgi:molybdopterin/thiamine biosynthesis adenylyltransferase/rhodanese-related sulfurtransferase